MKVSMAIRALSLLLVMAAAPASGQSWPGKPVRFLVGFAPGGSTDIVARLIAQEMGRNIGQQVVVENRPGAGSAIAAELTAKASRWNDQRMKAEGKRQKEMSFPRVARGSSFIPHPSSFARSCA